MGADGCHAPFPISNSRVESKGSRYINVYTGWCLNHPSKKHSRQNGSVQQIGMKDENV